ncbi:hypothetical protein VM1G_11715 [Cytospora mali]|uniref:Uncharacterized protein n=1 Tax=Cytospora mali TaxID=578113 RepID=A0A194W4A5_CYTMA|nr:hypothetical protein VM1G_11715 [Valsa mali]
MASSARRIIVGLNFLLYLGLILAGSRAEHRGQTVSPSSLSTTPFPIGPKRAASTGFTNITLGQQQCQDIVRDESQLLASGAVDPERQKYFAEAICQEISQLHIQISDPSVYAGAKHHVIYFRVVNSLLYNYEIEWINGCEQTLSQISVDKPLPGSEINCSTLWIGDYTASREQVKFYIITNLLAPQPQPIEDLVADMSTQGISRARRLAITDDRLDLLLIGYGWPVTFKLGRRTTACCNNLLEFSLSLCPKVCCMNNAVWASTLHVFSFVTADENHQPPGEPIGTHPGRFLADQSRTILMRLIRAFS